MSNNSANSSKESPSDTVSVATTYDDSITRDFSLTSLGSAAGNSSSQEEVFRCNEHAYNVLKHMQTYYDNKQLCDVVLIAGIDGVR